MSGKLEMKFSGLQPWADADVIETDYDNYAVLYSCTNLLGVYTYDLVWILMKHPWTIGSEPWIEIASRAKAVVRLSLIHI